MKHLWVYVRPFDKKLVTTALENGATGVIVNDSDIEKVKELGKILIVGDKKGDFSYKKDIKEIEIKSKEDEIKAAKEGKNKIVIIKAKNWKIIPLENLIASGGKYFAEVSDKESAITALQVLESGVDGIVIKNKSFLKVKEILNAIHKLSSEKYNLVEVEVVNVKTLGMSDRVCIDTTTNMNIGEGMLTGNSATCLFLVHSESIENPYVSPRPFRVNAGAVHAYILTPGNKTKYLSELKSGDEVLIVDSKGNTRVSYVGRVKIEKRPMLLIEGKYDNNIYSIVLQNAETIRLTQRGGKPISVVNLKKGDKILAYIEKHGRHFGLKIKETITEK